MTDDRINLDTQSSLDLEEVAALLDQEPGLKARQIAQRLGTDRRLLNQALHSNIARFRKDSSSNGWFHYERADVPPEGRPHGPFGPAERLVPRAQRLTSVDQATSCRQVQQLILDRDYSAIPVVDSSGLIMGIATLESIAHFLLRLTSGGKLSLDDALNSQVRYACEPARFIGPSAYIDLQVDWSDIQNVIVGTSREPIGILTLADVWAILHRFTEAFVLIHEIETGLRTLILETLKEHKITIEDLLASMHVEDDRSRPESLDDLTFNQYLQLMYSKCGKPAFTDRLGDRKVFQIPFNEVNRIRNEVMHFRHHDVPAESIAALRRFRLTVRS